jgi:hypothetical protein
MKNILLFSVVIIPLFLIYSFSPNENPGVDFQKCKVLKESINKEYEGECKKGLANGQGTAKGEEDYYQGTFKKGLPAGKGKYVWGNGEFYIGDFKNGMRHGKGVMYTLNEETGAIEKNKLSMWKEDVFVMEVMEEKYKIIQQRNVVGVHVKKMDEERDRVEIRIKNATEMKDLVVNSDVGSTNIVTGNRITIDFIEFPINIKINFTDANKFNTSRIAIVVEMEIESPGNWTVEISR